MEPWKRGRDEAMKWLLAIGVVFVGAPIAAALLVTAWIVVSAIWKGFWLPLFRGQLPWDQAE